jgi:hypothetical protein
MYSRAMCRFCCSFSCASCLRDLLSLILSGFGIPLRPARVELVDRVEAKLVPKCTVTRPDSPIIMVRAEENLKTKGGHRGY